MMILLNALRDLFRKKHEDNDVHCSIVMLLRSPFAMSREVLELAASKAFKQAYDGSHEMYFVVHDPVLTVVKAGPSAIQVLEASKPYLGNPEDVATGFNDDRLASAWREHRTWVAFDFMDRNVPKREAYRVLAAFVTELLDARCTGIYLPKENQFTIQSDGSAARHLRQLS